MGHLWSGTGGETLEIPFRSNLIGGLLSGNTAQKRKSEQHPSSKGMRLCRLVWKKLRDECVHLGNDVHGDGNFCFFQFSAAQKDFVMSWLHCSFLIGRDAFISMEPCALPRNSRFVSGPIVFFHLTGGR